MAVTVYTLGDTELFRVGLQGIAMLFDPTNTEYWVSGTGAGLGAVAGVGLMFTLGVIAFTGIFRQNLRLDTLLVVIVIYSVLFVPKERVQVEDLYSGQVAAVDGVPIGIAYTASLISGLSRGVSANLETAFKAADSYYQEMTVDGMISPLSLLVSLRHVNPHDENGYIAKNIRSFAQFCIFGYADFNEAQYEQAKDKIGYFLSNHDNGLATYYSAAIPAGEEVACSTLAGRLSSDLNAFFTTSTGGDGLSWFERQLNQANPHKANISSPLWRTGDVETAMTSLLSISSADAQVFMTNILFQNLFEGHAQCSRILNLDAYEQCVITMTQAFEQAKYDAAGTGSFFQKTMVPTMNLFMFMFYAISPIIALVIALAGMGAIKIVTSYFLFGIWTQTWMPVAAVINFFIQSQTQIEFTNFLNDLNAGHVAYADFYDVVSTKILVASNMLAATPMITLALLSGSIFALTHLASAPKDVVKETQASPDLQQTGAVANFGGQQFAAHGRGASALDSQHAGIMQTAARHTVEAGPTLDYAATYQQSIEAGSDLMARHQTGRGSASQVQGHTRTTFGNVAGHATEGVAGKSTRFQSDRHTGYEHDRGISQEGSTGSDTRERNLAMIQAHAGIRLDNVLASIPGMVKKLGGAAAGRGRAIANRLAPGALAGLSDETAAQVAGIGAALDRQNASPADRDRILKDFISLSGESRSLSEIGAALEHKYRGKIGSEFKEGGRANVGGADEYARRETLRNGEQGAQESGYTVTGTHTSEDRDMVERVQSFREAARHSESSGVRRSPNLWAFLETAQQQSEILGSTAAFGDGTIRGQVNEINDLVGRATHYMSPSDAKDFQTSFAQQRDALAKHLGKTNNLDGEAAYLWATLGTAAEMPDQALSQDQRNMGMVMRGEVANLLFNNTAHQDTGAQIQGRMAGMESGARARVAGSEAGAGGRDPMAAGGAAALSGYNDLNGQTSRDVIDGQLADARTANDFKYTGSTPDAPNGPGAQQNMREGFLDGGARELYDGANRQRERFGYVQDEQLANSLRYGTQVVTAQMDNLGDTFNNITGQVGDVVAAMQSFDISSVDEALAYGGAALKGFSDRTGIGGSAAESLLSLSDNPDAFAKDREQAAALITRTRDEVRTELTQYAGTMLNMNPQEANAYAEIVSQTLVPSEKIAAIAENGEGIRTAMEPLSDGEIQNVTQAVQDEVAGLSHHMAVLEENLKDEVGSVFRAPAR